MSFKGFTLEDTQTDTLGDKDPIDPGNYDAHVRTDGSKGFLIELEGVSKFTNVQIHVGNTVANVEGCFATGTSRSEDYVGNSRSAMKSIRSVVGADGSGDIRVEVYGSSTPPKSPVPVDPALDGVP